MKFFRATVYGVIAATSALAASVKEDSGSFSLADTDDTHFTFKYSTAKWPDEKNWIAIWGKGKGPSNDKKGDEDALVWDWTPGKEGEVKLPATPLSSGEYDVYFLWKGGFESMAKSINVKRSAPANVKRSAPAKSEFTVLTYNLWRQGSQVNGYKEKQVDFLKNSGADIIAMQETSEEHTSELAKKLNWNSWKSDDHGILTRYPIVKRYGEHDHGIAASIALDDDKRVNVWDVHLAYDPYGPYNFCFEKMSADKVRDGEESSGRGREIRETLGLMKADMDGADKAPVLLMGDFNAPSHKDWTDETADLHCGVGAFDWPTSKAPIDAGLKDSLREVHPDPKTYPALTWSPVYKDNEGRSEPQDRLDFIYHKGGVKVLEAEPVMVGKPSLMPNHKDNEWTSDHRAVKVKYSFS